MYVYVGVCSLGGSLCSPKNLKVDHGPGGSPQANRQIGGGQIQVVAHLQLRCLAGKMVAGHLGAYWR